MHIGEGDRLWNRLFSHFGPPWPWPWPWPCYYGIPSCITHGPQSVYITNFVQIGKKFVDGSKDGKGRTEIETGFIRSTRRSWS